MTKSLFKALLAHSFTAVTVLLIAALFTVGCSSKRHLSDDELAMVFHDAFLSNAYTLSAGLQLDSLKLYEPIFQKYGYSVEDVQQTIGNFSRRKSARLSDVVERAIAMLESEGRLLDREVAILDSVNNIARRRASEVLLERSALHLRSVRDTADMKFTLRNVAAGRYRVEFDYLIDSLDKNSGSYVTQVWSQSDGDEKRYNRNSSNLSRGVINSHSTHITIGEQRDEIVVAAVMAPGATVRTAPSMNVRIKNLRVTYLPSVEKGVEHMYDKLLAVHPLYFPDSLPL